MTYQEFIDNIIESRGRFNIPEQEYHERHHIVPKSIGGTNDENNLIDLYAQEHFIAHQLLAKEHPEEPSLIYAWWMMSRCSGNEDQNRYELTPEEYEDARMAFSKLRSEQSCGENNHFYGKHHTEETRKTMKENHRDVSGENNPMYGNGHLLSGENNGMCGVHRYGECAPNYGNKWTDEQKKNLSEKLKGKGMTPVYCIELDEEFPGMIKAEEKYGISSACIGACINGKQKTAGRHPVTGEKLHWKKLEK